MDYLKVVLTGILKRNLHGVIVVDSRHFNLSSKVLNMLDSRYLSALGHEDDGSLVELLSCPRKASSMVAVCGCHKRGCAKARIEGILQGLQILKFSCLLLHLFAHQFSEGKRAS